MKKMKNSILSLACALCAAFSLTSCLNDNGNGNSYTPPSAAEKTLACTETSGVYQGRIYFQNETTSKKDSASINYTVTDSTVVINNFPVSFLSNYVSDSNNKSVIAKAPTTMIKCKMPLYELIQPSNASVGNYYQFYFYPDYTNLKFSYSFKEGEGTGDVATGKSHEIVVQFMSYAQVSGYIYSAMSAYQSKKMQANFCIQQVTVDGSVYTINTAFGMIGKKGGFSEGE